MVRMNCPECRAEVVEGDLICGSCYVPFVGSRRPVPAPQDEPPAPPAEPAPQQEPEPEPFPRPTPPLSVPRPTTIDRAGVLELRFPNGSVVVRAGREVTLGRDPLLCPDTAGRLTRYDNVSRLHATVGLDPDGACWIRDEGSTNGTFVDGEEIGPGERGPLREGAELRLASDVTAEVHRLPDSPAEGR
ncbi:FHA domain-containing protein [Streptomyces sp. NBC_01451]|uniref:FHA domain-containing protein n=1 Tax=Streptomyces sp. NBC_01451 TaxID=2903872 RepID=UPI002E348B7F|nr:FHA domain-containing protein [Streptomyces sp. NBC_01451]